MTRKPVDPKWNRGHLRYIRTLERGSTHMDPKLRESVGLLRHQIISPVLMETSMPAASLIRDK